MDRCLDCAIKMASRKASLAFDSNYQQVFQYPLQYIPIDPKRVCSYIGFPSSFLRSAFLIPLISSLFPLLLPSIVCICACVFVIADQLVLLVATLIRNVVACISVHLRKPHLNAFDNPVKDWSQRLENWIER